MMIGTILTLLYTVTATLLLGGATMLSLRSTDHRLRKVLAWVMLIWGVFYLFQVLNFILNFTTYTAIDLFSPFALLFGQLCMIVLLCYPLEIVLPGWLSLRRMGLLLLPYLVGIGIYYGVLAVLGEQPLRLFDYNLLWHSIGRFNVWYRLLMVSSLFGYLGIVLRIALHGHRECYVHSYAVDGQTDGSWLHHYGYEVLLIGMAYLVAVSGGQAWCLVVHNLMVIVGFALILYKGLFYDDEVKLCNPSPSDIDSADFSDESFASRLPGYIATFERWMKETCPYRRQDFKLLDVMQVLPLNRTYLSRVFNEGMNCSFSMVVRNYRIAEAKHLLIAHPELSVKRIAEQCGFSSSSSFNRTFVLCEGLTPNQYRKEVLNE